MAKQLRFSQGFVLFVLMLIGALIAILPPPEGVQPNAFRVFGVFVFVILGILIQPYPIVTITLIGLFVCLVFGLISPKEGFASFGQGVIWLVVFASLAAKAFIKTNLGHRIACFFIKKMGHSSLALAYGLTLSDFVLSPVIPSNTARASCVSIPLTVSISRSLGSDPKNKTERLVGQFLCMCSMHANQLTCPIFLTAMASNPLLVKFMSKMGVSISWIEWFKLCALPGMICLFLMPLILYKLMPPELKELPQAKQIAQEQLDAMAPMDSKEWITLCVFAGMLVLWIFGDQLHVKPAVVALGGLSCLLLTHVLEVKDVTGAKDIWDIMIWLSILNVIAKQLTDGGLIQYYSQALHASLHGVSWPLALGLIAFIYYMARYLLPGNILHACAMFTAFSQLLMACGVPAKVGCMTLSIITALCGYVTPYATSPCPLYFNTGYIEQKLWWRMGFITGAIYLVLWSILGGLWWKMLGLYG